MFYVSIHYCTVPWQECLLLLKILCILIVLFYAGFNKLVSCFIPLQSSFPLYAGLHSIGTVTLLVHFSVVQSVFHQLVFWFALVDLGSWCHTGMLCFCSWVFGFCSFIFASSVAHSSALQFVGVSPIARDLSISVPFCISIRKQYLIAGFFYSKWFVNQNSAWIALYYSFCLNSRLGTAVVFFLIENILTSFENYQF